jgi:hypothetical protein
MPSKQKAGPKLRKYEPGNEWEALGYFIEEAGECLAAAGKTLRWGFESFNPEPGASRETNREWLAREVADLKEAIKRLEHLALRGDDDAE